MLPRQIVIFKAILKNLLAAISPSAYMKLTQETGRGGDCGFDHELEEYCMKVVSDYLRVLQLAGIESTGFIEDKVILEYGPGDFLGVALILIKMGAKRIYCIDRFPLKNERLYKDLYNKMLASSNYSANFSQMSWDEIINRQIIYLSAKDGIYQLPEKADLILSRAVLEHCNDLEKTFLNMSQNIADHGMMIHKVDFTSHGTHLKSPLDFLCYSDITWHLMTSRKGSPNRWRWNKYKELIKRHSFRILFEESESDYSMPELNRIRPFLAPNFRDLPDADLLCSDNFFVAEKV